MRRFQIGIGHDDDGDAVRGFDAGNLRPLFVEQIGCHLDRQLGDQTSCVLFERFFLHQAQNGQRKGFGTADGALTRAARADHLAGLFQRGTQALTGHFQQTKARNATDLHARTVHFQRFAKAVFHLALVLGRRHVDEIDDDQPPQIAQTQLTGNLVRCFQVGIEGGFLNILPLGIAAGVDVDRGQRFRMVEDQLTARRQGNAALIGRFDLAFDLETGE